MVSYAQWGHRRTGRRECRYLQVSSGLKFPQTNNFLYWDTKPTRTRCLICSFLGLNVGESGPLNSQQMVANKFSDLDGLFGGVLGHAMKFAKSKFSSPGELTLRKAIMVHLFQLGRLKLPTVQETEFQNVLTTDTISEWTKDSKVQAVMYVLCEFVSFLCIFVMISCSCSKAITGEARFGEPSFPGSDGRHFGWSSRSDSHWICWRSR